MTSYPDSLTEKKHMDKSFKKNVLLVAGAISIALIAGIIWFQLQPDNWEEELVNGNGRIEATEIDIATTNAGRVVDIFVREGDFVTSGQVLAQMQVDTLNAQRDEALAQRQQAIAMVATAEAQVTMRESDLTAAQALIIQRDNELENARRRLARTNALASRKAVSIQQVDDDQATVRNAEASLTVAKAQSMMARAAITSAQSEVLGARSAITSVEATVARIEANISDSKLTAPLNGRVQYRVAQPGEVLGNGGKVLNMIDLSDVYMTFFLPETVAGRVALDSDVRIILDAAPDYVIPAKVSFIASVAQFTPNTVETLSEREKLMFRVKARIDPNLLKKHIKQVKTGLPGVAWLKLDTQTEWPVFLTVKVPE